MNYVRLCGAVSARAVFSHQSHQTRLYRMELDTRRLSGVSDRLRVLVPEDILLDPSEGEAVALCGQMRSYNNKSGHGSRLVISVLAQEMEPSSDPPENIVFISGSLCKPPVFRRTPLGREICDIMLASPRTYNRADYLPLIAWGQTARLCASLSVGDALFAEGRFQSRGYSKVEEGVEREKTAYEISLTSVHESEAALEELRARRTRPPSAAAHPQLGVEPLDPY